MSDSQPTTVVPFAARPARRRSPLRSQPSTPPLTQKIATLTQREAVIVRAIADGMLGSIGLRAGERLADSAALLERYHPIGAAVLLEIIACGCASRPDDWDIWHRGRSAPSTSTDPYGVRAARGELWGRAMSCALDGWRALAMLKGVR